MPHFTSHSSVSDPSVSNPPHTPQDLQALLLGLTDPQLDLNSEQISFTWVEGE